ncbi:MAG: hypothetical protein RIC55_33965 [Pirellulaceae bacterium]
MIVLAAALCSCSSSNSEVEVESVEFYVAKLSDSDFVWHGPASNEVRIPKLPAARALAYLGDDAVPALFDVMENDEIDKFSIYDALAEIGLPVERFSEALLERRDTMGIRAWWKENRVASKADRSRHRIRIGLPAVK